MPAFQTSQVTLQLTGTSSVPNNFTVDIYSWDVPTNVAVYNRTIVTGLTRTTTSSVNGGSLTVSPYYEITGITGIDNYVKLTSTTSCTTTATQDITSAALTVYIPPTISENFSTPAIYDTFALQGSYLGPGNHTVATVDTLPYISASDFSLTYISGTYVSGGATVTGTYANGPFSSFSVSNIGKTFSLVGVANTSLLGSNNIIHGIMRLTYTPSGQYVNFNYYYNPTNV
jgi:hypothetical protein